MQGQDVAKLIDDWLVGKPAWYSLALHAALRGDCSSDDVDALAKAACEDHGIYGIIASDKHAVPYSRGGSRHRRHVRARGRAEVGHGDERRQRGRTEVKARFSDKRSHDRIWEERVREVGLLPNHA